MLRGNRDLDLLFGGQVVSSFGDWLYIVALITLAVQAYHLGTQGAGFLNAAYGAGGSSPAS